MPAGAAPHPRLRAWRDADLPAFAALHADPEVARWLGGPLNATQSVALFRATRDALEAQGWGVWAIQDEGGGLIGAAGLKAVHPTLPCHPAIEASWRLARAAWGRGYVTEVMRAVLDDAFGRLQPAEIVSFTSEDNLRSRAVMARLGFERDAAADFDHPRLAPGHPLRRHVFYRLRAPRR